MSNSMKRMRTGSTMKSKSLLNYSSKNSMVKLPRPLAQSSTLSEFPSKCLLDIMECNSSNDDSGDSSSLNSHERSDNPSSCVNVNITSAELSGGICNKHSNTKQNKISKVSSPPIMPRLKDISNCSMYERSESNSLSRLRVKSSASVNNPFAPVRSPPSKVTCSDFRKNSGSDNSWKENEKIPSANVGMDISSSSSCLDNSCADTTQDMFLSVPQSALKHKKMTMKLSRGHNTSPFLQQKNTVFPPDESFTLSLPAQKSAVSSEFNHFNESISNERITSPRANHRRKKPSGYQQTGRYDSEDGEYCGVGDHSSTCGVNEFLSSLPQPNTTMGTFYPRQRQQMPATPSHKRLNLSPKYSPYTSQQKQYPFSPNPFSPHYSPVPTCTNNFGLCNDGSPNVGGITEIENNRPTSPFVAPVKRHHRKTSSLSTVRDMEGAPGRKVDGSSTTANSCHQSCGVSPTTSTCNMSICSAQTQCVQQDRPLSPPSTSFKPVIKDNLDTGDDFFLHTNFRHPVFTGSPIAERKSEDKDEASQSDTVLEKSFDSSLGSHSPGGCSQNERHDHQPMVFSSSSFDLQNSCHGIKKKNLEIDCHHAKSRPYLPDRISPTDIISFHNYVDNINDRPPPTPFKERSAVSHTERHFANNGMHHHEMAKSILPPNTPKRKSSHYSTCSGDDLNSSPSSVAPPPPPSRFLTDFEEVGQLGTGSFGTVYECMSRLDGCMYAIKAAKRKAKGNAEKKRMLKEVYALAALCDKTDANSLGAFHIVRYHQAWMEDERLFIQTELCGSTLLDEMRNGVLTKSVPRRFKLLREILLALDLIHGNDMVHLDIKPENIFIKGDQYKLGDFGLVSKVTTVNDDVEEGDSRYMSLELMSDDHKDLTKSDIFSLGATLYEVCVGKPLPANGEEWHAIRRGALDFDTRTTTVAKSDTSDDGRSRSITVSSYTPPELKDIVRNMMSENSSSRLSASELLRKKPLLSKEQRQLITEQNKVKAAYESLAMQKKMMTKFVPMRNKKRLVRSSTWDVSMSGSF